MVKVTRPMWVSRINRRMSFKKFRENFEAIHQMGQDYSRIIKSPLNHVRDVYEVTVETWADGEKNIWIPEELAEVTGEMYTQFMENQILNMFDDESDLDSTIVNEGTFSDLIAIGQQDGDLSDNDDDDDDGENGAANLSMIDIDDSMNSTMVQENQGEEEREENEGENDISDDIVTA